MSDSSGIARFRQILPLIGGRYAFSWILVVGSFPLLTLGFVVTEIGGDSPSSWWAYALVALIGQLALALILFLGHFWWKARNVAGNAPWWGVLAVYFLAGQLRVVVIELGMDALDLFDDVLWGARSINSAVMFPLLFGFSALTLEWLARYHDQRAQLVRSLVEGEVDLGRQRQAAETLRSGVLDQVDRELRDANRLTIEAISELEHGIAVGNDLRPDLQRLLEESDRRWRGISHSAWNTAEVDIPRPSIPEYLTVVARSGPLSLFTLAASGLFMYSLVLGRALEPFGGLATSLVWVVGTLSGGWLVNQLGATVKRFPVIASAAGVVALLSLGSLFLIAPGLTPSEAVAAWTIHITNIFASLILGFAPSLLRNRQETLKALRKRLDQSTLERLRTESELVVMAQQIATFLHGTTRADFLVRVLTLQKALDRDDKVAALETIESLKESLSSGIAVVSPVVTNLEQFLANWSGFVTLEQQIEPGILDGKGGPAVTAIVIDAVNNAIRHGAADWIRVELAHSENGVDVRVMNNGSLVASGRRVGLGSQNLDRSATGGWSLDVVEGKTLLEARILASSS